MEQTKKDLLEDNGWKVTNVKEFLNLTDEDQKYIDEKLKRFSYIVNEMYLEYQKLKLTKDEISEFTHFLVQQTLEPTHDVPSIVQLAKQMFYAWHTQQRDKNIDDMKEFFQMLVKYGNDILLLAMRMQSMT